jgi:hypothetical protein
MYGITLISADGHLEKRKEIRREREMTKKGKIELKGCRLM